MKKYINISVVALLLFGLGCIKQQINPVVDKKIKEDTSNSKPIIVIPKDSNILTDSTRRGSCNCKNTIGGIDTNRLLNCYKKLANVLFDTTNKPNSYPVAFYKYNEYTSKLSFFDFWGGTFASYPNINPVMPCDSICSNIAYGFYLIYSQAKFDSIYKLHLKSKNIDSLDMNQYNLITLPTLNATSSSITGKVMTHLRGTVDLNLLKLEVVINNTNQTYDFNMYFEHPHRIYFKSTLPIIRLTSNGFYKIPKIPNGYSFRLNHIIKYDVEELEDPLDSQYKYIAGFKGVIKDKICEFIKN